MIDMFIGLGKMIGKSKIRIGAGMRITKKNAMYMWIVLLFYYIFLMMWYVLVFCFWLMYAVCYGFYALIRWIVRKVKGNK